jgi:hypothetical protein
MPQIFIGSLVCLLVSSSDLSAQTDSATTELTLSSGGASSNGSESIQMRVRDTAGINKTKLAIVGGTALGIMAGIHVYQTNGWWKDNRRSFHFQEDLKYGLSVDKLGHFYGASVGTFIISRALRWADFSESSSLLWGAGVAALFQTYVEVQDGFSTWGFDRVDFAANIGGAFYPVGQHYVPFLRNFDFKFSYQPSPLVNEGGGVGFQGQKHIMFDDYEGQTIWLGAKVNNLVPKSIEQYWPDWLGLAVGYGARDILKNPHSVYIIGLDYDMTEIIPDDTWFLKTLGQALNFIRFPAPAVRISPSAIWYGLYF